MNLSVRKKKSRRKRMRDVALYWGLPVTAAELVGAPLHPALALLLFAIPLFFATTVTAYFIELGLVKAGERLGGRS